MSLTKKHFVEYLYLYPGSPIFNTFLEEVEEREVKQLPDGAVGYRFFDGAPDNRENVSGWYYKGKKVEWKWMKERLETIGEWAVDVNYERELLEKAIRKMDGHDVVLIGRKPVILQAGDIVLN